MLAFPSHATFEASYNTKKRNYSVKGKDGDMTYLKFPLLWPSGHSVIFLFFQRGVEMEAS